jgi:hypothetical protein
MNRSIDWRDTDIGGSKRETPMLDAIVIALVTAYVAIVLLGHVFLFTAIVYRVDGLPDVWRRRKAPQTHRPQERSARSLPVSSGA